jgi:hypothetical protein
MQMAYRGDTQDLGPHTYTLMEDQWAGEKVGTISTFNDLT